MDRWTWPAYVGVIGGALLFVAILVPILIWQTRRYGQLSWPRLLGAAALSVYGVALVAYTLLPLPSGDLAQWCAAYGVPGAQMNPLQFVDDVRRESAGLGTLATLRSTAALQVVFNVLLFVPWGLIARRYLGWNLAVSVLSAFAASVAIEATQYTGIWGIIGCSYRVADVDDVLANTLGGLLGALAAPLLLRWMPQASALGAGRRDPRPVTVWRRWFGMVVDALLFTVLGMVLAIAYRVALLVTGREIPLEQTLTDAVLVSVVPFVLVFCLPPLLGSGASWGQRTVWLAPSWPGRDRPPLGRRLVRAGTSGGLWGVLSVVELLPDDVFAGSWSVVPDVAAPLTLVVAVVAVVAVPWTRGRRGLSGVVAGAEVVDSRA